MRTFGDLKLSDFLCSEVHPTGNDLMDFESKNGVEFPEDYKNFLLLVNGGTIWTNQTASFDVAFPKNLKQFNLRSLFSFRPGNSKIDQPSTWKGNNSIRPKFIYEIGSTESNYCYVCLYLNKDDNFGKVYLYVSDKSKISKRSSPEQIVGDKYFVHVSDSFTDFCHKLKIGPL